MGRSRAGAYGPCQAAASLPPHCWKICPRLTEALGLWHCFGPWRKKVLFVSVGWALEQGFSWLLLACLPCPPGPHSPASKEFSVPRRSFCQTSFPVISNNNPLCLTKTAPCAGPAIPNLWTPKGTGLAFSPCGRISEPASPVKHTLLCWIKAKRKVSNAFLELSLFCRLRGLTVQLFGPVGLEITHKSFLFQTQLVVRNCVSVLCYGLLVSQELSVPVVMITREMHNGMSSLI